MKEIREKTVSQWDRGSNLDSSGESSRPLGHYHIHPCAYEIKFSPIRGKFRLNLAKRSHRRSFLGSVAPPILISAVESGFPYMNVAKLRMIQ